MNSHQPIGNYTVAVQTYTLIQVCMICDVTMDLVSELVAFGIVSPSGDRPASWRFNSHAILRAKKAVRLHRDLGLECQGLALSLDLLDEIEDLHRKIASFNPRNPMDEGHRKNP